MSNVIYYVDNLGCSLSVSIALSKYFSLVFLLYHFKRVRNYEYFKCRKCKKVQLERIDLMLAGEAVGNRDIDFF